MSRSPARFEHRLGGNCSIWCYGQSIRLSRSNCFSQHPPRQFGRNLFTGNDLRRPQKIKESVLTVSIFRVRFRMFSASGCRTYKGLPLCQPGETAVFLRPFATSANLSDCIVVGNVCCDEHGVCSVDQRDYDDVVCLNQSNSAARVFSLPRRVIPNKQLRPCVAKCCINPVNAFSSQL